MMRKTRDKLTLPISLVLLFSAFFMLSISSHSHSKSQLSMLSDPFLQLPTENSVRVVWFTDFAGSEHRVFYGEKMQQYSEATTIKLSRMREDAKSNLKDTFTDSKPVKRDIWRHEAVVGGLTPGNPIPYQVMSAGNQPGFKQEIRSNVFTLAANPTSGTPVKILLTSDHQLMPMLAANLQKVVETVGRVDGVFMAGDLVNVPDRASEWFDDLRGGAFFPCLQGRANYELTKNGITTIYEGGKLIQHAPLFPAIGNHEVMGKFSLNKGLNEQFDSPSPRSKAEIKYHKIAQELPETWLKDNSFNTDTYEEIFTLPQNSPGGKKYYAITFGDIRLVVLYITNIWRSPQLNPNVRGRYQERETDFNQPENWGYGQHIFEPIAKGSLQYTWLQQELNSEEFQQAKYKIVMFHHPVHTLGGNIVPPYTNPQQRIEYNADGSIKTIRYDYPQDKDYLVQDLMPILESAGVHFVFYGHSHLWNRFVSSSGIHFLESSNVGNSYGAHLGENKRPVPQDNPNFNYAQTGDPNGLEPIVPNIAPLKDENGQPLPYIASNDITVFSILDTGDGTISSYRFDTSKPDSEVVKFDQFAIKGNRE